MRSILNKLLFIGFLFLFIHNLVRGQSSGFVSTGLNFGFINKKVWQSPDYPEEIKYRKPLIRPIFEVGFNYMFKKIQLHGSLMYQTKGQGTSVPRIRNLFQSKSPDAIHFISIPFGVNYQVLPKLKTGLYIQPSLFLGGTDNYYSSKFWKGWVWSSVFNIQFSILDKIDIGINYDYDFTYYYCDGCDDRFNTFRIYTSVRL